MNRRTFLKSLVAVPAIVAVPLVIKQPKVTTEPTAEYAVVVSKTNFAALSNEQKKIWGRDMWNAARKDSLMSKFIGENNAIQIHS